MKYGGKGSENKAMAEQRVMNRQTERRGTISSMAMVKKKSKEGHVKDKHTNRG